MSLDKNSLFKVSLLLLTCFSISSLAEVSDEISSDELSLQERSSKRLFPGGADESDLKVLKNVTEATQKLTRYQIEKDVYQRLFNEDASSDKKEE